MCALNPSAWESSSPGPLVSDPFADGHHVVQLYEDDAFLVEALARFVSEGLAGGDAVIVIATDAHRTHLDSRLASSGVDLTLARQEHRYVSRDAAETLSTFMVDGWPNEERFTDVIGGLIAQAKNAHGLRVRAFGEMVGLLWAEGNREGAIHLEELWNNLARQNSFGLLCGYPLTVFGSLADGAPFERMCARHSHVVPAESYTTLTSGDDRLRFVTQLQQRASVLPSEEAARKVAEAELRRQQAEMAEFFENAALPLHLVGPDGSILHANRAELQLLGYDASEYIGHSIADFHVDQPVIDDILERLRSGETLKDYEARLRCKDGSIKYVLIDSNVLWREGQFVHTRCITRDITAFKDAQNTAARLAGIVESSNDAIVAKTLDGIVTSWNRAAERIFGYTAEEMIGQPISRIIPAERGDDFPMILEAIRRGERVDHFESERVRKDGRRIYVSLTVSPIRDATGRIIGASKIARDVTDRKIAEADRERLLRTAEQARAEAETATRAKDEFLSVVSHELRTPLASILGWTNVLKMGGSPERTARAVETIERSGQMQAKLIEDLVDVSRIISGRMRLDLRLVDLPGIMRDALDAIRPTADVKGIQLSAHIDSSAGPVAGDADRLHQVAWNLLSNAVKFTPAGGRVELRLVRRDEDVLLVVRDTGCGVSADFLPFVFERFRQAESVVTRRAGGLGLGLSIVRHLVELHGGTVGVESEGEGKGSVFSATFPLMPLRGETAEPGRLADLLDGLRVLLVEDDDEARDAISAILELHGARVVAVPSAEKARLALEAERPDALVSDIGLPGDDGYALIRELRASPRLCSVPALAVSGEAEHDGARALSAGYHARLAKPFQPGLLVTALARLTARSNGRP